MGKDVFCRIVSGEIPSYKLYEDEDFMSFLDVNPIRLGHTLLITKKHYKNIYEMPEDLYNRFFLKAKELSLFIQDVTMSDRVGLVVAGLDIDHVHIHLLPINEIDDLDFKNQHKEKPEYLAKIAKDIKIALMS